DLSDLLKQRNIPEETIETMLREKVLAEKISISKNEELKNYLPSYGDRIALLGYCKSKRRTAHEDGCGMDKEEQSETTVKKNALKSKRKIEIGWLLYDEQQAFKQVRTRRGGGTRKVDVSKDAKKCEIIQMALGVFFPNGRNREGSITDFEIDLKHYQEVPIDDKISVGQMFHVTKLTILRFYLTTHKKKANQSVKDQDSSLNQPSSSSAVNVAATSQSAISIVTSDFLFVGNITNHDNINFSLHSAELREEGLDSSNIVFLGPFSDSEPQILGDTLPLSPQSTSSVKAVKKILVVHRAHSNFSDDGLLDRDFKIQLVLPDGTPEMGYDDGGVVRDCLSEFWKCTTGNTYKVPFLRHDYGQQQWESVGRIIVFGWTREKYLPMKIAPVILEQAAFGQVKSEVVENFLKCMPESERFVFQSWQSDFSSVDKEELIEILDNYSCRRMPTASNVNEILQELAHKTLVQEPAYVIEQWAKTLSITGNSFQDLYSLYENLPPNARKVLKSIVFAQEMNIHQKDIQKYVSTYIRNADLQHLSLFLRFCTGSDLFLDKKILIDFTKIQGFLRRPVAHTCSCVLELSIYYDSYPDFSAEMNKVLESNVWVMDII
uniref:HECT domain-containing protein n=1 Tax=Poecilia formosa TaxID=48698 RepID=A0A096MIJ3_POEFO